MSDFEKRLRASLRRHAAEAPNGDRLVERILRETSAAPAPSRPRRRREWRTWTLPLATAGAVAAIAAALVGVNQVHHSASPAGSQTTAPNTPLLTSLPTGAPQDTAVPTLAPDDVPAVPRSLTNVHVLDATFVGPTDGWLLANAKCLDGKPGQCTAMLRTVDGGAHWTSLAPPPANVPGVGNCDKPCVDHIRFANSHTGYAFGRTGFFLTTDGGAHWTQQNGGAEALETLDNNVIRVTTSEPGCPPPGCTYVAETSDIGSSTWSKPHRLNAPGMTTGAQLVRSGNDAYALVTHNPAGGAGTEWSTLFVSHDDGASWVRHDDPCAVPSDIEADGLAIAASPGRLTALCQVRQAGAGSDFFTESKDAGANFRSAPGTIPQYAAELVAGDPTTVLAAAGTGAYRSTDGGMTWQRIPQISGQVSWLGFESPTVGRIVSDNGRTIWTTQDAGAHWTPFTFG